MKIIYIERQEQFPHTEVQSNIVDAQSVESWVLQDNSKRWVVQLILISYPSHQVILVHGMSLPTLIEEVSNSATREKFSHTNPREI
jgi:hypothetical protein